MKLSAPVHRLKRQARLLSRDHDIPLHQALDRVAASQGFASWSLLAARTHAAASTGLFARLGPGDLALVAARPGQGKTLMGLKLAVEAIEAGNDAHFFTLEYTQRHVFDRLRRLGGDPAGLDGRLFLDCSDAISADRIMGRLALAARGTLAVIDYLQILDQNREKPALDTQVRAFRAFAKTRGVVGVFISQIDRSYDPSLKACPDLADIRLPNPLDLSLFDKAWFLNGAETRFQTLN